MIFPKESAKLIDDEYCTIFVWLIIWQKILCDDIYKRCESNENTNKVAWKHTENA